MARQGTVTVLKSEDDQEIIRIGEGSIFSAPYNLECVSIQECDQDYLDWLRKQYHEMTPVHDALMDLAQKINAGENVALLCEDNSASGRVLKHAIERLADWEIRKNNRKRYLRHGLRG